MADSFRDALKEIDQSTDYTGMRKAFDVIAPSIAPTIGAISLTPALGPWAGPIVGGIAGEMLNNVVGVTNPSLGNYAAQALVPPVMRGAGNLKRLAPRFGTESRSAESLNQIGLRDLRSMQQEYQPLTPSEQLFARVGNDVIPMPHAKDTAESVLRRIEMQLPSDRPIYGKSKKSAEDVIDLFQPQRRRAETPNEPAIDLGHQPVQSYESGALRDPLLDRLTSAAPGRITRSGEQTIIPPIVDQSLQSSQDIAMGKRPTIRREFPDLPTQRNISDATVFPKEILPPDSSARYPETIAGVLQDYLDQSNKNKFLAEEMKWQPGPGGLPASRFQEAIRTAGERLRAARRGEESVGGSTNVRNYSELFSGYARDLDASPLLRRARDSFKREQVLTDIGDMARPFVKKGVGEAEQVNVNQLMNRLKDDTDELGRFYHQAFDPQERTEILRRLGRVNELPGIAPGTGQATGSSKVNPVIAAMLGAGSLGAAHGGAGEAMGAAAGAYALSGAGRMARDLSIAYNIPAGRALITQLLDRSGGKLTPEVWAGIQAFAASQTANLPANAQIIKTPRQPMLASTE